MVSLSDCATTVEEKEILQNQQSNVGESPRQICHLHSPEASAIS